jgi:hypothetical protein
MRGGKDLAVIEREYPGRDSELYALLAPLPPREPGETLSVWLMRVAPGKFDEALRLHLRYRFDPKGLSVEERTELRVLCRGVPKSAA